MRPFRQSNLFRTCSAVVLASVLTATGAAAQPPDLTDFKTVQNAATTQFGTGTGATAAVGRSGYLGVSVLTDKRGKLVVAEVAPDSPAARASIAPGDVLDRVDDKRVADAEELRQLLKSRAPGAPLQVRTLRGKKRLDLTIPLDATSRPLQLSERRALLGLSIGDPDEKGAPVRQVVAGSPAEGAGIKTGDVIVRIDGAPITLAARLTDSVAEKQPGDKVSLVLLREGKEVELQVALAEDRNRGRGGPQEGRNIWKKDVYRLAVICVEYPDVQHNAKVSAKDWEESLYSKGTYTGKTSVTGQPVYGSLNDYYLEQSAGAFHVEGKVFDWVTASKKRMDYSLGTGTGNRSELLLEAIELLLARDGRDALSGFDGVYFVYAGERVRTTRGGLYWPHRSSVTHRGKSWPYFIMPEGGERMASISTVCHEFGHMLGLPDLYARPENPGSEGLGIWCAMSNEAPNGRPQHMSAWCKEQLGWLKPAVVDPTVKQKLLLSPIEGSSKECYKVLVRADGSEYLLLENRRRQGFDASLPAEGLLIWRVVGGRPMLEESHGVDGPPGPQVFPSVVPYPSKANTAYTPFTTPSSRSQLGGGLPVHVTNIRQLPDGRISFYLGYEFD
jgi:M6 family metalloprotease-like protein